MIRAIAVAALLIMPATNIRAEDSQATKSDYPTAARADYVIGCLAANGFKQEYLERCACGIDTIAEEMLYEDYEKADTILRMQQGGLGDRGAMFRDTPIAKEETEKLRRAQAEVNLRCH